MTDKAIKDANDELARKTAEQKRKADAEALAKKQAEDAEAKRLEDIRIAELKKKALAPDKDKLQEFLTNFKLDLPTGIVTAEGQAVVARAKQLHAIMTDDLQKRITAL